MGLFKRTMVDKQKQRATTKQQTATHLSQQDRIEKLNLTEYSFNALTSAGIQTVGELLKLVESGELRAIHGLKSTSILEIEIKLAHLEILDNSEVEANAGTRPDKENAFPSRKDPTEKSSLTEASPNQLHTHSQAGEVDQQVKSGGTPTTAEAKTDSDTIRDYNSIYLSREDAIEKLNLPRRSLKRLKRANIRTVGELAQRIESGRFRTIYGLGSRSIIEIKEKIAQVTILDDSEIETNSDKMPEQNDISLSGEESSDEPSLTQSSTTPLTHTEKRAGGDTVQHVQSDELHNISEDEVNEGAKPEQADVPQSGETPAKKIRLTRHTLDQLKQTDIRTVGELVQWIESGKPHTAPDPGQESTSETTRRLAQAKTLDDSETEAATNTTPDRNEVSLSQEDSAEEQSSNQHSSNLLTHTDSRTSRENTRQLESSEPQTTFEGEANTNTIPSQNDTYLSRGDAIEKLNLSQRSLKALKRADIRMVGELLQRVELGKIRVTRGLGRKSITEIEEKLAQVKIYDNYIYLSREDSITQLYLRNRSFNALTHAGVQTIGEALQLVESNGLERIPALGRKSIVEIKNKLAQVATLNDSEGKVNTNSISDRNYVHLSLEDPIEQLNFTPRSFNALTHAGIQTVGEVLQLVESDRLKTIRGLGRKSIVEIKEKLIQPKSLNDSEGEANTDTVPRAVIRWQSELINKQLSRGLLHKEAIIAEQPIKDWLAEIETIDSNYVYEVLATILGSSVNICEEIEFFLDQIPGQYRMTVLLTAHGLEPKNLRQTGDDLGISHERVRQIRREIKDKATSIINLKTKPNLLRIQSALFIARDLGLDITYEQWTQRIRSSGLVGDWRSKDFVGTDTIEAMVAICNLLADCKIYWMQIPKNLQYAIQLATEGRPNVPAKIPHKLETLPDEIKRLINGHTKNSGGVHVKWLSQESGVELEEIKDILQWKGYTALSKEWFVLKPSDNAHQISHLDVFHRCLRKMFQYCGPLNIDDVCAGLRHLLSRKHVVLSRRREFPVPPPDVMAEILSIHNYECKDELYYWDSAYDENLNEGETIIMDRLEYIGPVMHHSELVNAFIESDMSFPLLHATLNYSPLFDKIEYGLYKLRGKKITYQDMERAKAAGAQQSPRPEVEFHTDGNIIVGITLSAVAVGSGTIFCERFPDLSGANWECYVGNERAGELSAVENEFRRLKKTFELLNCQPGERLKFTFNTWERTVEIEKEMENGKD